MKTTFFIAGQPKPQARPRFARRGKFVTTYSETTDWKKTCIKNMREIFACVGKYENAIRVDLDFYFQRPKSHYRTGKFSHLLRDDAPKYHIKKPDKDNLEKAVTDAMTDAGLIKDDCIIVGGETWKSYACEGDEEGCSISISEIE